MSALIASQRIVGHHFQNKKIYTIATHFNETTTIKTRRDLTCQKLSYRYHRRCSKSCKSHYSITYVVRGHNRHIQPTKLRRLNDTVRKKITTLYLKIIKEINILIKSLLLYKWVHHFILSNHQLAKANATML